MPSCGNRFLKQYPQKPDLIVVPDGSLHLLPFAALVSPEVNAAEED
jgi:hypothetical protein